MQAVSQQTPSTQLPDAQSLGPFGQLWPFSFRQWPAPSHEVGEAHTGAGSWPYRGMFVQVPALVVRLHAMQLPAQAVSQQTPSMQLPEPQAEVAPQVWPFAALQTPAPSQTLVPAHAPAGTVSGAPAGRLEQVPSDPVTPQDLQVAVQVLSQQKPSTQLPLTHSRQGGLAQSLAGQAVPLGCCAWHMPLAAQ
jgi:hypothetical protein